ncbi:hypothetical protein JCM3766R1_003048 [Sporobolomyces carnicolor]
MFSDISLDRVALYAALCGTAFGLLFGVFGMATTLSLEQVQFFPFFCIASGLWGVLALIEAAIYLPFRREDPSTSNVFATGKKTLLLHAVWFLGGFVCSIVLYSIWNSQDMSEKSGQKFALGNGILFGEILLGVVPHLGALGLYFYTESNPSTGKKKHKHKSKKSKANSDEEAQYDDEGGHASDDPDSRDKVGTGGLSDDDLDAEKQALTGGVQDDDGDETGEEGAADGSSKSKSKQQADGGDGDSRDGHGDEDSTETNEQDYASGDDHASSSSHDRDSSRESNDRTGRNRRPKTGRDVVTEQDWDPQENRYENYSPPQRGSPQGTLYATSTRQEAPAPVYSYTPGGGTWTPVQPGTTQSRYGYPPAPTAYAPAQSPTYTPYYSQYPPVSPTYASPPASPSLYPVQAVSPPYAYPVQAYACAYPYTYGQSPYSR